MTSGSRVCSGLAFDCAVSKYGKRFLVPVLTACQAITLRDLNERNVAFLIDSEGRLRLGLVVNGSFTVVVYNDR